MLLVVLCHCNQLLSLRFFTNFASVIMSADGNARACLWPQLRYCEHYVVASCHALASFLSRAQEVKLLVARDACNASFYSRCIALGALMWCQSVSNLSAALRSGSLHLA